MTQDSQAQERSETLQHQRGGRARAALTGVMWSGVNTLTPALVGMLVFVLTSRVISPAEFGVIAFAVTISSVAASLSPAGFGDALIQRHTVDPAHLDVTFWLCLGSGLALYGIVALISTPIASLFGDPRLAKLLPVVSIRIIFDLLAVVPSALLTRALRFRQIAIRTILASSFVLIACLAALGAGYGYWALALSQIVASIVSCVVSWISVDWRPRLRFSEASFREIRNFGFYSSGSKFITTLNVDQLLLGALLGSASLGLFSFAKRIFQMLNDLLTGALGAVSFPFLASLQNEPEKLNEAYLATTFLSSALSFPLFVGLALVAKEAIPLFFGAQWIGSVQALQIFCAIGLLSCIGILQAALIRAKGRADWWMWYQTGQQILTAIIVVVFSHMGITAVVLAMAIKTWITWPVTTLMATKLLKSSLRKYILQFTPPLASCLVMAVVVKFSSNISISNLSMKLFVEIFSGGIAYSATFLLLAHSRVVNIISILKNRNKVTAP